MEEKGRPIQRNCTFRQCGYQMNPREVKNTVSAGNAQDACMVCGEQCLEECQGDEACLLATANVADQEYLAGFCPCETLKNGTMFPELIRPYAHKGGC